MSYIGLSATRVVTQAKNMSCTDASAYEGAVVMHNTDDDDTCKLATGAAVPKVCGVIASYTGPTGTTALDRVLVQTAGQASVLLAATATVVRGDLLITANSSGHVKAWTNETSCTVIGYCLTAKTAGAAAEMIPVQLSFFDK